MSELTRGDMFAAHAMAALIAFGVEPMTGGTGKYTPRPQDAAKKAWDYAEAMEAEHQQRRQERASDEPVKFV